MPDYEYYHLVGIKLSPEAGHRNDPAATSAPVTFCTIPTEVEGVDAFQVLWGGKIARFSN